jgi:hypothetical protein
MHAVLEHILRSPKANESLVNYGACQSAMKTPNASVDELEKSCELYVTRSALGKAGFDADTKLYPASYLSNCTQCGQVWAEPAINECRREAIDSGDAPLWCSQPVCFVSAAYDDAEPSVWFPGSRLFYSYRQCGSMDLFSMGRESCASINKCNVDDGCERTTVLDDPVCCLNISDGTVGEVSAGGPLAKFGLLVGAVIAGVWGMTFA